jgi:L-ascorbate metabolism protein UlaG (beta-lactamase superfamily)
LKKLLLILLAVHASCFLPHGTRRYSALLRTADTSISSGANPSQQLKILYTGCGGLLIETDSFSILIDPFYSNKGLPILWGRLKTNKAQADEVARSIEQKCGGMGRVKYVCIAHSHYDHLFDLPYMLNRHLPADTKIICSQSSQHLLQHCGFGSRDFFIPRFDHSYYDSLGLGSSAVLKIIRSEHAPHTRFLFWDVKMMTGEIPPNGVQGFDTTRYQTCYTRWKEGQDFSFLLELKTVSAKPFRIFIQSSSCTPPAGLPHFLNGQTVDLALIGVASTNYTKNYPQELLALIKPKHVILIHWEDFFRAYKKEPKIVRFTRMKEFAKRIRAVEGADYLNKTSMPKQLSCYTIKY